eukprot:1183182-Prorocentrum_minimum.AAC.2
MQRRLREGVYSDALPWLLVTGCTQTEVSVSSPSIIAAIVPVQGPIGGATSAARPRTSFPSRAPFCSQSNLLGLIPPTSVPAFWAAPHLLCRLLRTRFSAVGLYGFPDAVVRLSAGPHSGTIKHRSQAS